MINSMCLHHRSDRDEKLSPHKIQSTIIFNLVVLSQLANTCKAVIEVSRGEGKGGRGGGGGGGGRGRRGVREKRRGRK